MIQLYLQGKSYKEIGTAIDLTSGIVRNTMSLLIKELNIVQESNKLSGVGITIPTNIRSSKEITDDFKAKAQDNGLIFAYYYGLTNDIKYSLHVAELDEMPKGNLTAATVNYIYRVRGQFLLSIPAIREEVNEVRKQELKSADIDKPYVVAEIINQLEQEKILADTNPASRKNAITLIKMLGDTCSAFSTTLKLEENTGKDNLDQFIELAKQDIINKGSYTIEEIDND